MWASNDGEYFSPEAPIYFIKGKQRGFRRDRGGDQRSPPPRPHAELSAQRRTARRSGRGASPGAGAARSRRAGTTRPARVAGRPSEGPQGRRRGRLKLGKSRDDKRRHFVRDEGDRLQDAVEHRSVPDARSAAPVSYPGGAVASTRGKDRAERTVLAAMKPRLPPVRPITHEFHRFGAPGRCARSASTSVTKILTC